MRLRAIAFALGAFGLVAGGAWQIGRAATDLAERRVESDLAAALADAGHRWARPRADGLRLSMSGRAPDEASRFHALELARAASLGPIADRTDVASAVPPEPPAFALELLRSEDDLSLIGLAPAAGTRAKVSEALAEAGLAATVTEMLETAAHPAPPGWDAALNYGLALVSRLPRAKVSVAPGAVAVTAAAENEAALASLARRIEAEAPPGVAVTLDLSAPRPVIAPYTFAIRKRADGVALLVACDAETEADAAAIHEAARAAGADNPEPCRIGLGAPSPAWAEAAAEGIAAVTVLGGGSFAISDMDAVLVGPPRVAPARLAEIGTALERDLPAVFTVVTRSTAPAAAENVAEVPVPEFHAVLEDGAVHLAGPVSDKSAQIAILGFAEALFGHDKVQSATVLDPNLPGGWPVRILSAVEALALLEEGQVAVTADHVTVSGRSLQEEAEQELRAFFAVKEAGAVLLDVDYDAEAAAALAEAARPPAEVCAERIAAILGEAMITFPSGSAEIDEESAHIVEAIAGALAACPGARFEVAGHTDSEGDAAANQALSEARAEAVADALQETGAFVAILEPRGYGPDQPIADNDSAEGRALNRRIEFSLLPAGDAPPEDAPPETAEAETAEVDGEPGPEAAGADGEN